MSLLSGAVIPPHKKGLQSFGEGDEAVLAWSARLMKSKSQS